VRRRRAARADKVGEVKRGYIAARQPRTKNHMKMPRHLHKKIAGF